jgi:hypothetical protein
VAGEDTLISVTEAGTVERWEQDRLVLKQISDSLRQAVPRG